MTVKRSVLYAAILCIILLGVVSYYKTIFMVRHQDIRVVCDPLFSLQTCGNLTQEVGVLLVFRVSAEYVLCELQKKFSSVHAVRMITTKPTQITVSILARRPRLIVNNLWVIAQGGTFSLMHEYAPVVLGSLMTCYAPELTSMTDSFAKSLAQWEIHVHPTIIDEYRCEWHDATHIVLHDKNHERIALKTSASTDFHGEILASIARIKQLIVERENSKKNKKNIQRWDIDTRFEYQLVLSHH